jgi:ZIP family zinc transporter
MTEGAPHASISDKMAASFGWGLFAGASLILGSLIALRFRIDRLVLGIVMAFGAGVLISAVAFDLIQEAYDTSDGSGGVALGLFAGCAVFFAGDVFVDRLGGADRKSADGAGEGASPLPIVLGIVLDGVPESMVIGLTILEGGAVSAAYLAAVFLANLPEAIAATTGMVASGWRRGRILGLWTGIALLSAAASAAGYVLLEGASPRTVAFVLAFAAGAIITMLADTMMPEAYEHGGRYAGVATTIGFAAAFAIHTLE